jgi:hypothetical protein
MEQFDHLSIFVSMIIALGVRHLILSVANMINLRGKVRIYYPTLVWMIFLLSLQLQIWWVFYYRHEISDWSFFAFLFYLYIPITVSMLSHLLVPEIKAETDLEKIYYHNRKWFLGLIASVAVASLTEDFISFGYSRPDLNFWFRIVFILFSVTGLFVGSKRLQMPIAFAFLFLFIAYVALIFLRLA